jgi:hypothetical protein
MKPLFELIAFELPKTKSNIKSERSDIISQFVEAINVNRPCTYIDKNGKKKTVQKITPRAVAVLVGYLKTNGDLYFLLSICRSSKCFSKSFFLNTKSHKYEE